METNTMKALMPLVCIVCFCTPAWALNQYNTNTLSCSEIQGAVQRDGQAQLRYRSPDDPSQTLYDVYVANSSYCNARATKTTFVPAKDRAQCKVRQCKRHPGR